MMHGMHLSAIDLNLLPLLHAVLEEQNVTRAGRRVGLSPSAASHALGRLREILKDPLLVRTGRRLTRTPRGNELLPQLQGLVRELEVMLRPVSAIDPKKLVRAFKVVAADDVHVVLLRVLDRMLREQAPAVQVFGVQLGPDSLERLRHGEADLAVAVYGTLPDEFARAPLFVDELVPVARRGHRAAGGAISLRDFAAFPHLLVAPLGTPRGLVDDALESRKLKRHIARTVPTFLDGALLAAENDYVVTLPARFVEAVASRFGLVRLEVPLQFPRFQISAVWHRRWDADPAHIWFRNLLANVARPLHKKRAR
jgi:DNA-binding transcriptional LysR family regulator